MVVRYAISGIVIGVVVWLSVFTITSYSQASDCYTGLIWHFFALNPVLECFEERLDAGGGSAGVDGNQMLIDVVESGSLSLTSSYMDAYSLAFAEENKQLVDFSTIQYVRVIWQFDRVTAPDFQVRWVDVSNNTNVLYESSVFTTDQDPADSNWFALPVGFVNSTKYIEMQAKSPSGSGSANVIGYKMLGNTGDLTGDSIVSGEANTGSNIGSGTAFFAGKSGVDFRYKTLVAGSGISVSNSSTTVTVTNTASGGSSSLIGAVAGDVYLSQARSNIGTAYVDVYQTAFDEENSMVIDFRNATYFRIVWQWDYVGAGTQQVRWVNVDNNAEVLLESATFTADRDPLDQGWLSIPAAFSGQVKSIEWQGKSTTATDDPVGKGYKIYLK